MEKQPGDSFPGAGLFIGIYFGRMFLGAGLLIFLIPNIKFIFRLEIHIFKLDIRVLSLEIHVG